MGSLAGLRTALAFLTVLRVAPREVGVEADAGWLGWAPVVGLGLGGAAAALLACLRGLSADPYQQLLASALVIGALALATGGLHLDGLADTADGLGAAGSGAPEGGLAAMRDPHLGAFGASALALVLLVEVSALWQAVTVERGTIALLVAVTTGRLALLWGTRQGLRPARLDGLGSSVIGRTPVVVAVLATAIVLVLATAGGALNDGSGVAGAGHAGLACLGGLGAAIAVRRRAERRLGGVTGDVLGAMVEAATATVLVVMAYSL